MRHRVLSIVIVLCTLCAWTACEKSVDKSTPEAAALSWAQLECKEYSLKFEKKLTRQEEAMSIRDAEKSLLSPKFIDEEREAEEERIFEFVMDNADELKSCEVTVVDILPVEEKDDQYQVSVKITTNSIKKVGDEYQLEKKSEIKKPLLVEEVDEEWLVVE